MLLDDQYKPIDVVNKYLKFLDNLGKSPNTQRTYAYDLLLYCQFMQKKEISLLDLCNNPDRGPIDILSEFVLWLQYPDYSKDLVYNTFPIPEMTEEQKTKIAETAQAILEARKLYPNSSLADLYDPLTMPDELRKAHIRNDKAVMQAYGFSIKDTSETDCVEALMRMYEMLTK